MGRRALCLGGWVAATRHTTAVRSPTLVLLALLSLIVLSCADLCADDWHMHHHGSRYPHSWASDKNRVEEFWEENEPRQAAFRAQLYEREGMVSLVHKLRPDLRLCMATGGA